MIPKVKPLPNWILTDLQPAFYDTEAATVLELLSKIYGKMNELVEDYNLLTVDVNAAIDYMKDNLQSTVEDLYYHDLETGTLTSIVSVTYDSDTEALTIEDTLNLNESEES